MRGGGRGARERILERVARANAVRDNRPHPGLLKTPKVQGAVADTGSLILPSTGARAVQLLPPVHIVWVPAGRVFARLEDALLELRAGLPAAVGLHSGPSKSADIGGTVVTGVHGPGRCIAVLEGGVGQLPRADLKSD